MADFHFSDNYSTLENARLSGIIWNCVTITKNPGSHAIKKLRNKLSTPVTGRFASKTTRFTLQTFLCDRMERLIRKAKLGLRYDGMRIRQCLPILGASSR